MTIEVSPRGTKGARVPPPGPLRAIFAVIGDLAFRVLGDRMRIQHRPVLRIETVGAKSRTPRRTIVVHFPDREDSWLVVASIAGAARHPGWFHNLAQNPDEVWVELPRGARFRVRPETLRGAEREEAWRRIVALSPVFAKYQRQTDRVIPVVRLTQVPVNSA